MIKVKKDYYPNGNISIEEYYLNEMLHREDGSAYIMYYDDGNICREIYYLNDKQLTEQEWFNKLSAENKLKVAFGVNND